MNESRFASAAGVLLSLCALVLVFAGLHEWDVPLARLVRSLSLGSSPAPHPWLALLSDLGDRIGKGDLLVVLSLVLLAVGYGLSQQQWKDAGRQSLIAHGLVAVIANIIKHAVGRPRPKFLDTANFEFAPVHGSGWDSFPSGHASAAFAVATVLAIRFPRLRWPLFAVAMGVAASRVVRGSHFLTDVAGGAVLGCVMGVIAVHPWREWRVSASRAIGRIAPFCVAMLVVLWTVLRFPSETWLFHSLVWGGMVVALAGLGGHVLWSVQRSCPPWLSGHLARAVMGLGFGMTTGSLFVTTAVLFVCAAHWLAGPEQDGPSADGFAGLQVAIAESVFAVAVLVLVAASYVVKGIVPM